MILKRLEIQGFKSFADRTVVNFERGMSGIIGPNGCGKSNIVDAIIWCLGEMKSRSLRSGNMLDVIFSGTAEKKALSMAEVSITFTDTRGKLPIAADEVTVTRRLYRSKESEYLINGQPCRRKDIVNLFLDTGIGVDAYSIMAQGKLDKLLATGSVERRAVFEEAAGIHRYKRKKHLAALNLDRCGQNLLRLNDIIEELENQMRRVQRQAKKAERYRLLQEEFNRLRLGEARREYCELCDKLEKSNRRLQEAQGELATVRAEIETLERGEVEKEESLNELLDGFAAKQKAVGEIKARIGGTAQEIENARNEQARLLEEGKRAEAEIEKLRNQAAQTEEKIAAAESERAEVLANLDASRKQLETVRAANASSIAAVKSMATAVAEKESELRVRIDAKTSLERELGGLLGSRRATEERWTETEAETVNLHRLLHEKRVNGGALSAKIGRFAAIVDEQDRRASELEEEIGKIETETGQHMDRLNAASNELASRISRLDVLEGMERHSEGLESGVREILAARENGDARLLSVRGIFADLIEVDHTVARAVEAILGDTAQAVVVEKLEEADRVLAFLKEKNLRAHVMVLEKCPAGRELLAVAGGVPAANLVRAREQFRNAVLTHLADGVVTKDFAAARKIAGSTNNVSAASPEGDLFAANGLIVTGTAESAGGILTRKSEIRKLKKEIETIENMIASIRENIENRRGVVRRKMDALEEIRRNRAEAEIERLDLEQEKRVEENRVESARRELKARRVSIEDFFTRVESFAAREGELHEKSGGVAGEIDALRATVGEIAQSLAAAQAQVDSGREEAAVVSNRVVKLEERTSGVKRELTQLADKLAADRERLAETLERTEQARRAAREIEERFAELDERIRKDTAEQQELETAITKIGADRERIKTELDTLRAELRAGRKRFDDSQTGLRAAERFVHEHTSGLTRIAENVRENLGLEIEKEVRDFDPSEPVDHDAVKARIAQLKQQIEALGSVNLEAIDEKEELDVRLEILTAQVRDIRAAENSLNELVKRIDEICLKRFEETFAAVNENFRTIFRKLFHGGNAEIVLEESEKPLDAGVDIRACPPGKKIQSISLLSGGERALTTIALQFALFKTRPSPFCILDEVDGPLDDRNIDRFIGLLEEFLSETQFIIITHNKITMRVADVIYGVSMPNRGISKVVSLDFDKLMEKPKKS